jgi:putative lipoprotein (rSAM/lipoprotein system)
MNTIKTFVLRFRANSLKYMLRLLGLSGFGLLMSCTKYGAPVAEYGVPWPDNGINFHGSVVSQDSLKPIPNIQVKVFCEWEDTVYDHTNAAGTYSAIKYAYENQKVKLKFTDNDGPQNGKFFDKAIEVDVSFRDVNNLEHQTDVQLQRKP